MACDVPELCKFPSLNTCQKRFLWTHEGADLASHPVVGLVLRVGDTEKFPQAFGFRRLGSFSQIQIQQRAPQIFVMCCYSAVIVLYLTQWANTN